MKCLNCDTEYNKGLIPGLEKFAKGKGYDVWHLILCPDCSFSEDEVVMVIFCRELQRFDLLNVTIT